MEVKEKVILVTGGAGGIGLGMVKKLLQNGAKGVAIVDICDEGTIVNELEDEFGKKKVIFIKTDVTVKTELENAFDTAVKTFNQLDVVVNNAGIVNESDWMRTIAVNLVDLPLPHIAPIEGTYLAMQKYLPRYKSGEEGVVVNTASILGLTTLQSAPMYCSSKHGLVGFGKSVGGEAFYKKYKVRVLTLCPGLVDTSITKGKEEVVWFPDLLEVEIAGLNREAQSVEAVGEALIEVIRRGRSGSLWVTEDEKPVYEVVEPHRSSMKV